MTSPGEKIFDCRESSEFQGDAGESPLPLLVAGAVDKICMAGRVTLLSGRLPERS